MTRRSTPDGAPSSRPSDRGVHSLIKLLLFLVVLIAALQYRLWFGDGGIREYQDTLGRIEALRHEGEQRRIRNAAVAADVEDLRDGTDAIEERARHDLGLVRPGETYVQIYDTLDAPEPVIKSDGSLKKPLLAKPRPKSKDRVPAAQANEPKRTKTP